MKKEGWLQRNIMPLLALITVIGGGVLLYLKPELKTEIVAFVMLVLGYYFGSSPGSRNKDNALITHLEGQTPAAPGTPASEPHIVGGARKAAG